MKKKQPEGIWNEETGTATVNIFYNDKIFTGVAQCHADDMDFCSSKTGFYIAESRAAIALYQYRRDELKQQLAALNQLYYTMNKSTHFNPKSYEATMLWRQINFVKADLANIKIMITRLKEDLREYLRLKEELRTKLRKNRQQAENK